MFVDKKLRREFVLAPICALLFGATAVEAAQFQPELTLEARYDDNILKRSDKLEDFVGAVVPRLRLLGEGSTSPWELRLRRSFASYARDPGLVALSDLAMGRAAWLLSPHDSIHVDGRLARSSEPVDFDHDGVVTGDRIATGSGNVEVRLWRGEATFRSRDWRYDAPDLTDGRSRAWDLGVFARRSPHTEWKLTTRGQDLDLADLGVTSRMLASSIRRQHSPSLASEVELGVVDLAHDDGTPDQRRAAYAVSVSAVRGRESAPLRGRVGVARDLVTTALVEIEKSSEIGKLLARWESSLDVEGGLYRKPTVSRRASLGYQGVPDGIHRVTVQTSYRRIRPYRGDGARTNVFKTSASVYHPVSPWLTARGSYDFYHQDVPAEDDGQAFGRHRLILSITAGWRP